MIATGFFRIPRSGELASAVIALVLFSGLCQPAYSFTPPPVETHVIPYSGEMPKVYWTYGCTPTAASMILGYWDNVSRHGGETYGRLVDYYYGNQCGNSSRLLMNVPNTIDDLRSRLQTDWSTSICDGSGGTQTDRVQAGIRETTNDMHGYRFTFDQCIDCNLYVCGTSGDWCWAAMVNEINAGRPFLWSHQDSAKAHSVAAWGYRIDKYVVVYDTWPWDDREDWNYSVFTYQNGTTTNVDYVQVDMIRPGGGSDSTVWLEAPIGGEVALFNHPYQIRWYQVGSSISYVDLYWSYDNGQTWQLIYSRAPSVPGDNSYLWTPPAFGLGFDTARVRIEGRAADTSLLAGDGSPLPFTMSLPLCSALTYPQNRWQRVWSTRDNSCFGDGPDEPNPRFDNNWGGAPLAYNRTSDIQFTSSRSIPIYAAGTYRFTVGSFDGIKLWVDDVVKLDKWYNRPYTADTVDVPLSTGWHKVRLDYYVHNSLGGRVSFSWNTAPDLAVQSITTNPATPDPGQAVNVTVTVKNVSGSDVLPSPFLWGGFWVDFYKDRPAAPAFGETGDFWCRINGLAAGATTTCTGTVTYSTGGTYQMWAQADSTNTVAESPTYKVNNLFTQSITVKGPIEITISGPVNPTNSTSATLTFTSSRPGTAFQCGTGNGMMTQCTSPVTLDGLSEGSHTFFVSALDQGGNAYFKSYYWVVDLTPPDVTITDQPANTSNSTTATFAFTSSYPDAIFLCCRDFAVCGECKSPKIYEGVALGYHNFQVQAHDAAGNYGLTKGASWTIIDTTPPEVTIVTRPVNPSNSPIAAFTFTASEPDSTFQCSLDASDYAACASPKIYPGLAEGAHVFTVLATDPSGNTAASPASYTWSVATGTVHGKISAGVLHDCRVTGDGTVACQGDNTYGKATPPAGTFTEVSAGDYHTCGLKTDGTIACWGRTTDGQTSPPAVTFIAVSAGRLSTCGVKTDGAIACWGDPASGLASPPAGTFIGVAERYLHACGVKSDGAIACWGGDMYNETIPPAGTFAQVTAGNFHTCGLRIDGTVACWGNTLTAPTGIFTGITAGGSHTCGLRSDGTITCWGDNGQGQAAPPGGTFTEVSAGDAHTCGLRIDNTLACWGYNGNGQAPAVTVNPLVLPSGTYGASYTQTLTGSGSPSLYAFKVAAGLLPSGLSVSGGGTVSGTPTVADSYSFTVQAVDAFGNSGFRSYVLPIGRADQTITVTSSAPAGADSSSSFVVVASATSGLGVAITTSGACSGGGTGSAKITMTSGSASCAVLYSQAGSAQYHPAQPLTESVALKKYVLTMAPSGAGNGSVGVTGASCIWNGSATGVCSLDFLYNAPITLSATAGTCSYFRQWNSDCTGTDTACSLSMTRNRTAGAAFDLYPLAWSLAKTAGYPKLADACTNALDGAVIHLQRHSFAESLNLAAPRNLSFDSGWNCDYTQRTGSATVKSLTISKGSLRLVNGTLVIGP